MARKIWESIRSVESRLAFEHVIDFVTVLGDTTCTAARSARFINVGGDVEMNVDYVNR